MARPLLNKCIKCGHNVWYIFCLYCGEPKQNKVFFSKNDDFSIIEKEGFKEVERMVKRLSKN